MTISILGVNGGWSAYGPWGKCSRFCGGGTQSRSRSCSSPKTIAPGKQCVGGATETRQCPAKPCPGKIIYFKLKCFEYGMMPYLN